MKRTKEKLKDVNSVRKQDSRHGQDSSLINNQIRRLESAYRSTLARENNQRLVVALVGSYSNMAAVGGIRRD